MTLSTLADLSRREEPVSTEELARLALVLRRIEGTDKLRLERERAVAKAARAAPGAGQAPVRKGLSPEAVAAIREVVEGRPRQPERAVTSAPVDPWNPAESQLIPLNPGESRSENVSERVPARPQHPPNPLSRSRRGGADGHSLLPHTLPAGEERAGERWAESYAGFDHPATAPLIQLGPNLWLQELFHGPTLAFKDFALQMVARLLDAALRKGSPQDAAMRAIDRLAHCSRSSDESFFRA